MVMPAIAVVRAVVKLKMFNGRETNGKLLNINLIREQKEHLPFWAQPYKLLQKIKCLVHVHPSS